MVLAKRLFADRQRTLVERPGTREVALALKQAGEVVEIHCNIGMVTAVDLFVDRQRTLEQWPRAGKVALFQKQEGEVVEAQSGR
jgi:hypothetical protein